MEDDGLDGDLLLYWWIENKKIRKAGMERKDQRKGFAVFFKKNSLKTFFQK